MTALSLLPALLLGMTSFTRIMVVLAILRQALGTGQTPNNQVLMALSLFLTLFTMGPVFDRVNEQALQPYLKEEIADSVALERALQPFRQFMLCRRGRRIWNCSCASPASRRWNRRRPRPSPFWRRRS